MLHWGYGIGEIKTIRVSQWLNGIKERKSCNRLATPSCSPDTPDKIVRSPYIVSANGMCAGREVKTREGEKQPEARAPDHKQKKSKKPGHRHSSASRGTRGIRGRCLDSRRRISIHDVCKSSRHCPITSKRWRNRRRCRGCLWWLLCTPTRP